MRTDTPEKGTGGIARWAAWMPLLPRLGAFAGYEAHIPYDYHEVLGMVAPRPALVFEPKMNQQATLADVRSCVDEVRSLYDLYPAKDALKFEELDDYNRFSPETQKVVFERLKQAAGF